MSTDGFDVSTSRSGLPGRLLDVATYTLRDANGQPYESEAPGTLGGHRRSRIYGRLDCPGALRAIARGGYVANRVFFSDEATAREAGYRPCAVCLPERYLEWKQQGRGDVGSSS